MPSVAQHDSSKGLLGSVQSTLGWSYSCEPGTGDDVTKETSKSARKAERGVCIAIVSNRRNSDITHWR